MRRLTGLLSLARARILEDIRSHSNTALESDKDAGTGRSPLTPVFIVNER